MTGKNTETEKLSRNNGPKLCKCGKRHIFIIQEVQWKKKVQRQPNQDPNNQTGNNQK